MPVVATGPTLVANPLLGVTPALIAAPAGLQLAVIAGGISMPTIQVAEIAPVVDERPISRAGSKVGGNAFLPSVVKPSVVRTPVVPVYPRKQARH